MIVPERTAIVTQKVSSIYFVACSLGAFLEQMLAVYRDSVRWAFADFLGLWAAEVPYVRPQLRVAEHALTTAFFLLLLRGALRGLLAIKEGRLPHSRLELYGFCGAPTFGFFAGTAVLLVTGRGTPLEMHAMVTVPLLVLSTLNASAFALLAALTWPPPNRVRGRSYVLRRLVGVALLLLSAALAPAVEVDLLLF